MFRIGAVLRVGCLGVGVEIFGPGGTETSETVVARTPPMGWDSWDAFGESVKESDIRATADWMAKNLESYGWRYVVVDAGWYVKNHAAGYNAEAAEYVAVFNRADEAQTLRYGWKQMGLEEQTFMLRNLWEHKELGRADRLEVRLAPHASALYKILPAETHGDKSAC